MNKFWLLLVTVWVAFSLNGCKDDAETTPDTPTPETETPVKGDYVRVYATSDPDNLNPYISRHATGAYVIELAFSYLLQVDPDNQENIPELVEDRAEISDDGLEYTFTLHKDARWDNGDPILATDFLFSMLVVKNPEIDIQQLRGQFDGVVDVRLHPDNDRKFTVVMDELNFKGEFSIGGFPIISENFYDPDGWMKGYSIPELNTPEQIADKTNLKKFADKFQSPQYLEDPEFIYGSGPYKIESWERGQQITLVRKENYWGEAHIDECWCHENYPEKLIYKIIPDKQTASLQLKNQELDVMSELLSEDFLEFQEEGNIVNEHYNLYSPDMMAYTFIGMNCRPPLSEPQIFTDPVTRRAFAHLVDVDGIIEDVYLGFGSRILGPVASKRKEFNQSLKPIAFDIEKAKKLLAEAGWADSDGDGVLDKMVNGRKQDFRAPLMYPKGSATAEKMIQRIAQDADQAGVKVIPEAIEFRKLTEQLGERSFTLFGSGFVLPPLPPDMKQVWHTESWVEGGTNYFGFGNEESDSIITAIRMELDEEKRNQLYKDLQQIIYDWQPAVFMRAPKVKLAIHKRYRNARPSTVRPSFNPNRFWVPKEEQIFPKTQ